MQRLIDDANKVKQANGEMADLSIDSFADVTEAIHIIQTEMGITGTTAREAASTIEGSISMMKAAWQNLVVGMADENANMEVLINNFVESTAMAAKNLLPRIEQTLKGIGDLITALAPVIAEALPRLVEAVLPALLAAGISLVTAVVNGIITALPALYTALLEGVQVILVEVFGVSEEKAGEFAAGVNSFFVKVKDGFLSLVESAQTDGTWLNEIWTGLKETGQAFCDFYVALWDVLSAAFTWCVDQINTEGTYLNLIWENIKTYISATIDVIKGVIQVFTAVLKGDWSAAWEAVKNIAQTIWDAIKSYIGNVLNFIFSTVSSIVESIKSAISEKFGATKDKIFEIFNAVKDFLSSAWDTIKNVVQVGLMFIVELIETAFELITLPFRFIWENCKETIMAAWDAIKTVVSDAISSVVDFITGFWNDITVSFEEGGGGISGIVGVYFDTIANIVREVMAFIEDLIGVDLSAITDNVVRFIQNARNNIQNFIENVKTTISNGMAKVKTTVSSAWDVIKATTSSIWNGIKSAVSGAIDSVKSAISSGLDAAKSTVSSILDAIKGKFISIFENAKNTVKTAIDTIKGFFNFSWELPKIKLPHFEITGQFSLDPPSIPHFSVSWYKKAYDSAMVLGNPTIFGYSAASGKFLGGGDGNGNEIVAGESYLMNLIGNVVAERNGQIAELLAALLEATVDGNGEMVRALKAGQVITLNERELGRAVRGLA